MIRLGSIGARPSCRGLRLSWVRIAYTTLFLLVFTFSSKAGEWIHDRQSGCAVWNPAPQPGETIEWSGACADERASGYGILTWMRNGIGTETAKGNFAAGKLEGPVVGSGPAVIGIKAISPTESLTGRAFSPGLTGQVTQGIFSKTSGMVLDVTSPPMEPVMKGLTGVESVMARVAVICPGRVGPVVAGLMASVSMV